MDAVLGKNCVNDLCPALKNQSSADAAACIKKTHVVGEDVGRGGGCKLHPQGGPSSKLTLFSDMNLLSQGSQRSPVMCRLRISKVT